MAESVQRAGGAYPSAAHLEAEVCGEAVLADALGRIADGECVIDPTVVSRLVSRRRSGPRNDELPPRGGSDQAASSTRAHLRIRGGVCPRTSRR
jgi:hypothetical protein